MQTCPCSYLWLFSLCESIIQIKPLGLDSRNPGQLCTQQSTCADISYFLCLFWIGNPWKAALQFSITWGTKKKKLVFSKFRILLNIQQNLFRSLLILLGGGGGGECLDTFFCYTTTNYEITHVQTNIGKTSLCPPHKKKKLIFSISNSFLSSICFISYNSLIL